MGAATGDTDARAAALEGIAAGRDIYNVAQAAPSLANGAGNVQLVAGIGASSSTSTSSSSSLEGVGSALSASGDVNIVATGTSPGSGALNLIGSTVSGTNVTLAGGSVTLGAALDTASASQSSSSTSGSIGVALGAGGASVGATFGASQGDGSSSQTQHINSVITASNTAAIVSPGAVTLAGAQVDANQIAVQAGSLSITSLQDTASQSERQSSVSGSLTIPIGPGAASGGLSGSVSQGNGQYASVTSPSGLFAGDGGYQVAVSGATTLTGGYITRGAGDRRVEFRRQGSRHPDRADGARPGCESGGAASLLQPGAPAQGSPRARCDYPGLVSHRRGEPLWRKGVDLDGGGRDSAGRSAFPPDGGGARGEIREDARPDHPALAHRAWRVADPQVGAAGLFRGRFAVTTNKRDFDLAVDFYERRADGHYLPLASYLGRSSYMADRSRRRLLSPGRTNILAFQSQTLTARLLVPGSRIVAIVGVPKRPDVQINYGTGNDVSDESIADAKTPLRIRWLPGSYLNLRIRSSEAK